MRKTEIDAVVKKIEELVKEKVRLMKEGFSEGCKAVFEAHPYLKSFSWRQYTPYFNDGDECIFSSHTDYPSFVYENEAGEEVEAEEVYEYAGSKTPPRELAINKDVKAVLGAVDDDTLKQIFGDHVTVIVTREGAEALECSHD